MSKIKSKIGEKVRTLIRNWLQIEPAPENSITILEPLSFQASVIRNQIWYRGDASELDQLYNQLGAGDTVNAARFWAASPSDEKIRKIHSGLPSILVDTLAYLVKSDLDDITFGKDKTGKSTWDLITDTESGGINFLDLVGKGIVGALKSGDGAFKISIDPDLSDFPIVQFYEADRVDYIQKHGITTGINFWTPYAVDSRAYRLRESYETGRISYTLFKGETDDKEVPLDTVPELTDLASHNPVEYDGGFRMAIPLKFFENPKFPGRGKAIYENKLDSFDALDEVISQWMDALRAGRVKKYIPRDLIPTDIKTGQPAPPNDFGSNYIVTNSDPHENAQSKIQTEQPDIKYDAFLSTYTATLDMCLQGIVSPATLGIDVGKMSSADAQREKKDVTGYTRNTITGVLEKVLPELVSSILKAYDVMQNQPAGDYEPAVSFGEYGAPSFDARVDVVNKAATANTMSVETQVDELWGSSKDDDWKADEVQRIKQQRGIETVDEPPKVGDELQPAGGDA